MKTAKYCSKQLDINAFSIIKELFVSVFSNEPWNDDWSDENQLHLYVHDLVGQGNSLTFGLFEVTELIGFPMGHIKHWYTRTEKNSCKRGAYIQNTRYCIHSVIEAINQYCTYMVWRPPR